MAEYGLTGQSSHSSAWSHASVENFPTPHNPLHSLVVLKASPPPLVPAGQLVQLEAPSSLYFPFGHWSEQVLAEESPPLPKYPAAQAPVHVAAVSPSLPKRPGLQS